MASDLQSELDAALSRIKVSGTDLHDIEVKSAAGGLPSTTVDTLSAFANASGGLLILGISESTRFSAVEIDAAKIASNLASKCSDQLEPPIRVHIDIAQHQGKPVVVALIDEMETERKPCYVKTRGMHRGAYLRTHAGDRRLSAYEVHVLVSVRGQPREDESPVPGTCLDDLDSDLVAALLRRLRTTRARLFAQAGDEEVLHRLGVLVKHDNGSVVSLGGLLALGRYPQQFFPQLNLSFVASPTASGKPMADGTRFLDSQSIDGSIPVIVEEALGAMRLNMRRRAVVTGAGREDHWEYPEDAVRELVANALTHRDYHNAAQGTQTRLTIYPDRVEVVNPGGLFGSVARDDLMSEYMSASRNARVANLLEDVVMPGTNRTVSENRGTGLVAAALRRAGMATPEFNDSVGMFSVVVRNDRLLGTETLAWMATFDHLALIDRQRLALGYLFHHNSLTLQRYRTLTGCDTPVAARELAELAGHALVEKHSDGRWASWHLRRLPPAGALNTVADAPGAPLYPASTALQRADRRDEIRRLLRKGPASSVELAGELGIKPPAVRAWLRKLEAAGQVHATGRGGRGRGNRWALTE